MAKDIVTTLKPISQLPLISLFLLLKLRFSESALLLSTFLESETETIKQGLDLVLAKYHLSITYKRLNNLLLAFFYSFNAHVACKTLLNDRPFGKNYTALMSLVVDQLAALQHSMGLPDKVDDLIYSFASSPQSIHSKAALFASPVHLHYAQGLPRLKQIKINKKKQPNQRFFYLSPLNEAAEKILISKSIDDLNEPLEDLLCLLESLNSCPPSFDKSTQLSRVYANIGLICLRVKEYGKSYQFYSTSTEISFSLLPFAPAYYKSELENDLAAGYAGLAHVSLKLINHTTFTVDDSSFMQFMEVGFETDGISPTLILIYHAYRSYRQMLKFATSWVLKWKANLGLYFTFQLLHAYLDRLKSFGLRPVGYADVLYFAPAEFVNALTSHVKNEGKEIAEIIERYKCSAMYIRQKVHIL